MSRVKIGDHLAIDSEICHGQSMFEGTRIPVETVLAFLAKGYSVDQSLHSWPELSRSAIEEALQLAGQALRSHFPTATTVGEAAT